ncbi:MAG: ATP-binding protein [Candidatus Promineifilaceae bacterium]|nr:ATP-binding protein [Candidatus Promineifilaceae bacterium]
MMELVTRMAKAYDRTLTTAAPTLERGSLLLLSGMPASGKTMLANEIVRLFPAILVSTDAARRHLGHLPTYSEEEMVGVYKACYRVITRRLGKRQRVVFDASNHRRVLRQAVYQLAEQSGATIAVCEVSVSPKTARARLASRHSEHRRPDDFSDASWSVYRWMEERHEPIQRPKLEVDSEKLGLEEAASQVIAYWRQLESAQ